MFTVLLWSSTGKVTAFEGNAARILGASADALVGRSLHELLGITASEQSQLIALAEGGGGHLFLRGKRGAEAVVYRMEVGRDGGGQLRAEICDLLELLQGAPPVQIFRLSSSLCHEIRNPLSSVKMAVQTLAKNPEHSERDQRRLKIANREIRTMERMLALLSEYGREAPVHLELVALRTLVQEAAVTIELELTERQTRVQLDEDAALPQVKADVGRCRPVLAQLLLNVALGQEPGTPVVAGLKRSAEGASLQLLDRAAALLPAERETLFEPFGSRLARGAGLSLAALARVIQGQGGKVIAEAAGTGTLFTVTFVPG